MKSGEGGLTGGGGGGGVTGGGLEELFESLEQPPSASIAASGTSASQREIKTPRQGDRSRPLMETPKDRFLLGHRPDAGPTPV